MFALDDGANMFFKELVKLDDDQISNQFKKFYYAVKNNKLYFKDFETQDLIFKLFAMYNNDDILEKVEEVK